MKRSPIRCNLGIDVGTKALRVSLYRAADGAVVSEDALPLRVDRVGSLRQIDLGHVWSTLELGIDRMAAQLRTSVQIEHVAASSTASTVAKVDDATLPLGPGILWADHRALAEADAIKATGHPTLARMLGHVSAEWGLPKFVHLAHGGELDGAGVAKVVEPARLDQLAADRAPGGQRGHRGVGLVRRWWQGSTR